MMKILALENSTKQGSIAFLGEESEPIVFEFSNDRKHSGAFFQSLESLSHRFRKIDSIIVGLGPGSYVGIRIAIGAAIGLERASGARLVGLSSVCSFATRANEYCVIGDARRESFFFVRIRANKIIQGFDLYDQTEIRERLKGVESNVPVYSSEPLPEFEQVCLGYPSALVLAQLMIHSRELDFSPAPLEPIYLRQPHITIPRITPLIGS